MKREKASHGALSGKTISPISVGEAGYGRRGKTRVHKSIVGCATEITQNLSEGLPMLYARPFQKLGEMADGKCDVRLGSGAEVAQSANGAAIIHTQRVETINLLNSGFVQLLIWKERGGNPSTHTHIVEFKKGVNIMSLRQHDHILLMMNLDAKQDVRQSNVLHAKFSFDLTLEQ